MKNALAGLLLTLLGATLLAARPASATILYTAGEDTSGMTTSGAGAIYSGAGGLFRAAYARAGFAVENSTTVADPPAYRWQTPAFTASSTLWVHAQVVSNGGLTTTANEQALLIRSPDGVSRVVVRQTGTNGQLKLSTRNAAGTITDLATASSPITTTSAPLSFDLYVNYTCSGSGGVQLYLAGVQVINYSGNPCTDSATSLNQVEFASVNNSGGVSATPWSEIIITDTQDTRSMALLTNPPLAAGNTQSWTPNTDADINKSGINDATFIGTSSSNALSEWTQATTLPSTSNWSVLAEVQDARVEASSGGPLHFEWVARTGGTDNVTGSNAPTVGAYNNFQHIWATNPNTGVAWTTTDVTAAGFNLGIESLP